MTQKSIFRSRFSSTYLQVFPLLIAYLLQGNCAVAAGEIFGLFKSIDNGTSWSQVGRGLPTDVRINALIVVGGSVFAGTDRGIFVSNDFGDNWHSPARRLGAEARILCFAIQGERVLAGTHKHGVLVSDAKGTSWKSANNGLTDSHVRSLLVVGQTIYAGTDGRGIFVSNDGGNSWTGKSAGLPVGAQAFDLANVDGTVFAGLYSNGLYRCRPEADRWNKVGDVVPLELVTIGSSIVVGHNPGGVFVSDDLGNNWLDGNLGLPANAPVWTLGANKSHVFVGAAGKTDCEREPVGLFVSGDHGRSWAAGNDGLPTSPSAICFVATDEYVLAGISYRQ
ncbi:hypothetical protein GC207_04350 [bacterium]|nr:hypothetical protein [bacterium]